MEHYTFRSVHIAGSVTVAYNSAGRGSKRTRSLGAYLSAIRHECFLWDSAKAACGIELDSGVSPFTVSAKPFHGFC